MRPPSPATPPQVASGFSAARSIGTVVSSGKKVAVVVIVIKRDSDNNGLTALLIAPPDNLDDQLSSDFDEAINYVYRQLQ